MLAQEHYRQNKFAWGSKGETLQELSPILKSATIPKLSIFTEKQWQTSGIAIVSQLMKTFTDQTVIVRSSAQCEDGSEKSMAGAFLSLQDINMNDKAALTDAINQVICSMSEGENNQVIVQSMITNVSVSGVIMTYDVTHGSPYYCIDYDDESGKTDVITGGSGTHKSISIYRYANETYINSPRIKAILTLAKELETICHYHALDIEFAIDRDGKLYLLQVRRISAAHQWHPVTERQVKRQLEHVDTFICDRSEIQPNIAGDSNIFAVMPDWNPAEIIGTTPRPLSASLYQYLITKSTWRTARDAMGYRTLPDTDLMVMINNHPYIDVRNSFNSFLPKGLSSTTESKLINAWLSRLNNHPEFHDKVEFEIVPTCVDFTFSDIMTSRYLGLLSNSEQHDYHDALLNVTRTALNGTTLRNAIEKTNCLIDINTNDSHSSPTGHSLFSAHYLLSECKSLGALSFAIVARHAFIAEAILRSATIKGALSHERLLLFKRSIKTITSDMLFDYETACQNPYMQEQFLNKYGHLRPGTYEITSKRYDERNDLFISTSTPFTHTTPAAFNLTSSERNGINQLLKLSSLNSITADELLDYAKTAIANREFVKFIFTHTLSNALSILVNWGKKNGLSRDDLSFLEWQDIAKRLTNPIMDDSDRHLLQIAAHNRQSLASAHAFKLSHMISSVKDIYVATQNRSIPNFIGLNHVFGAPVLLDANTPTNIDITNHIVCIQNADPGFDWIFTKMPAALVTQFGGTNSHMAIRCAELNLPAAIGCGEQIFQRLIRSKSIELNCEQKTIRPTHAH